MRQEQAMVVFDLCECCGRPINTYDSVCRQCRKQIESERRVLRLAKERRRKRGIYGRV